MAARSASEPNRPESAFGIRERLNRDAKDQIGAAAAAMVADGESIAFDASTTALAVARHLKARGGWAHLTVITNGLRIASELAGSPGISVAMPGGFVRWEALSVVGQIGDGVFAAGQRPEGVPRRRRVHARDRVERCDGRGGADQAGHGRGRA